MSVAVYDAVLGANSLRQVVSSQYSANGRVIVGRASGGVDPAALYGGQAGPAASFDSADVAGALGFAGVATGLILSSSTITIPFNERANGGTFAGALSHSVISATDGLLIPTQIAASQDSEAVIASLALLFISSNGLVDPITINVNQSLAAQAFNSQFAMGPVYFGGSQVPEAVGWRVNPGIQVEGVSYNGGIYPTALHITGRNPTIEILFEDFASAATFTGQYQAMTSAAVYGRLRTDGGTFAADASLVHLKFSFAAGITNMDTLGGSGLNNGQVSVMLYGKALTFASNSSIP